MTVKRIRRFGSLKTELLNKSREAALSAVQIFNNPNISFKSETYILLMVVAWTYLLHAYYREKGVDYRYYEKKEKRRRFDRTKHNAFKFWELERCLNDSNSPVEKNAANNLRFLIGLRHEIEHQMTTRIDDLLSARFQACCLNYNEHIKKLFGENFGIEKHLSFSLQFSTISKEQKELIEEHTELPANIQSFIADFDRALTEEEYNSAKYAYRILFVPKTANRRGQADKVIEFVKSDSEFATTVNREYAVIKETEKPKYLAGRIVELMQKEGFSKFKIHHHTILWKHLDAKNPSKGFGTMVASNYWYWYGSWVDEVRKHCQENQEAYQ